MMLTKGRERHVERLLSRFAEPRRVHRHWSRVAERRKTHKNQQRGQKNRAKGSMWRIGLSDSRFAFFAVGSPKKFAPTRGSPRAG